MQKKLLLLILLYTGLYTTLSGQTMLRTDIPMLKKLPVNAIHRIFEDREGYIWYGTVNGLCRDDGYRIRIFRTDFHHPGLIDDNLVECINEDHEGNIWFGTDKGAYILSRTDYRIRRIDHPKLNRRLTYQLYTTHDHDLWISTNGWLLRYASDGTLRKEYKTYNGTQPTSIAGFCEGRDGTIYLSLSNGEVCRLDERNDSLIPYPTPNPRTHPGYLMQDHEHDYFWLCTWNQGLMRFDPSAPTDSLFVEQPAAIIPTGDGLMYAAPDKDYDRLWITTTSRLAAYDLTDGQARLSGACTGMPSQAMLNEIIRDLRGDLWVAAFDRPSFILHEQQNAPLTYTLDALMPCSKYHPTVMAICDSGDGIFWLFQERESIVLYDLTNNRTVSHKDFSATRSLPFSMVKLITGSRMAHAAWIVPQFRLQAYRLTRKGMTMEPVDMADFAGCTRDDELSCLLETQDGRYLYGGTHKGLFRKDLKTGQTTAVCDTMGHVTGLIETDHHTLYACTNGKGLYALSPNGNIRHYALPQALSCLTQTTDGTLWFGSNEGDVISMNPHDGSTQNYNQDCGLNGDMINRVAADEYGHIWIGTNQKIIEFNPHNRSYRTYSTSESPMNLWRIIPTAFCKDGEGRLYFGGISGICRFTPSNTLEKEAEPVTVHITDIQADGLSLMFDRNRTFGRDSVFALEAGERNLTICFSSLHHRIAHKIRYSYLMKDVDTEWQYTAEGEAAAVYSRLCKGNHEFYVRATDENGQWSDTVTVLHLRQLPAWYETWWAYLIYIIGIAGVIGYTVYRYVRRMQRKNEELWADSREMLHMREYLSRTSETEMEEHGALDKLLVDKAVKTVEAHLSDPDFDVQQLAEGMNMSRSTLTRKLKAITGDTPADFARHIRMKHARHILEDHARNISEVAAAVGYTNRKHFTQCFKDEFGMTPTEYREQQKDKE